MALIPQDLQEDAAIVRFTDVSDTLAIAAVVCPGFLLPCQSLCKRWQFFVKPGVKVTGQY